MAKAKASNLAVLYVRVSTQEQALQGVSLDAQIERLRAYCKASDLEVVEVIREEGVSASKPLATRPGGQQLVKLLASGAGVHVVSLKLDRLFRSALDALQQVEAWDKTGISLHLVDMRIDTGSPAGKFFLTMLAGLAEMERNLIAERTKGAMAYKKQHLEAYSVPPFGYDRAGDALIENPSEQAVLRQMIDWRREHLSLRAIASKLNTAGVPTKVRSRGGRETAGRWYAGTVRYILGNPLYGSTLEMEAA